MLHPLFRSVRSSKIFLWWPDSCHVYILDRVIQPSTSQRPKLKSCPPPTPVFTGRQEILAQMQTYFSSNSGKRHVFVLYGLGGSGKSQIAFEFVKICQIDTKPSRYATSLQQIHVIALELPSIRLGSQTSFSSMPVQLQLLPQTLKMLL